MQRSIQQTQVNRQSSASDRTNLDQFNEKTQITKTLEITPFDYRAVVKLHMLKLLKPLLRNRMMMNNFFSSLMEETSGVYASVMYEKASMKALLTCILETGERLSSGLYSQLRLCIRKASRLKIYSKNENNVRLESLFKMELRRQITLDKIRRELLQGRVIDGFMKLQKDAEVSESKRKDRPPSKHHSTPETSLHAYKLNALERVLCVGRDIRKEMDSDPEQQNDKVPADTRNSILFGRLETMAKTYDISEYWRTSSNLHRKQRLQLIQLVEIMSSMPLFEQVRGTRSPAGSMDPILAFALGCTPRTLAVGESICRDQEPMNSVIFVVDGTVASVSDTNNASKPSASTQDACFFLGELAALDPHAIWAETWRVISPEATIFELDKSNFDTVLAKLFGCTAIRDRARHVECKESPGKPHIYPKLPSERRLSISRKSKAPMPQTGQQSRKLRDSIALLKTIPNAFKQTMKTPNALHTEHMENTKVCVDQKPQQVSHYPIVQRYPTFFSSAMTSPKDASKAEMYSLLQKETLRWLPPIASPVLLMDKEVEKDFMPIMPQIDGLEIDPSESQVDAYVSLYYRPNMLNRKALFAIHLQDELVKKRYSSHNFQSTFKDEDNELEQLSIDSDSKSSDDKDKCSIRKQRKSLKPNNRTITPAVLEKTNFRTSHLPRRPKDGIRDSSNDERKSFSRSSLTTNVSSLEPIENAKLDRVSITLSDLQCDDREDKEEIAHCNTLPPIFERPISEADPKTEQVDSCQALEERKESFTTLPPSRPLEDEFQTRMNAVFEKLGMKAKQKLAVVLKYATIYQSSSKREALMLWERTTELIMQREELLKEIYNFELIASDPERHFRALSTDRLGEEKLRRQLNERLQNQTNACREKLEELEHGFHDGHFVCVHGEERSYAEKLETDSKEIASAIEQARENAIQELALRHFALATAQVKKKKETDLQNSIRQPEKESIPPVSNQTIQNFLAHHRSQKAKKARVNVSNAPRFDYLPLWMSKLNAEATETTQSTCIQIPSPKAIERKGKDKKRM